jgi:hypothetical protein
VDNEVVLELVVMLLVVDVVCVPGTHTQSMHVPSGPHSLPTPSSHSSPAFHWTLPSPQYPTYSH